MLSPELENLVGTGLLAKEPPARDEFDGLVRSGRTRLADARNSELALESRFDLAYSAAHALALAALRWHGYRPKNRYIVFQVLPHTLGMPMPTVRVLAKAHSVRNTAEYEGYFEAEEQLVEELIAATALVASGVAGLAPLP